MEVSEYGEEKERRLAFNIFLNIKRMKQSVLRFKSFKSLSPVRGEEKVDQLIDVCYVITDQIIRISSQSTKWKRRHLLKKQSNKKIQTAA